MCGSGENFPRITHIESNIFPSIIILSAKRGKKAPKISLLVFGIFTKSKSDLLLPNGAEETAIIIVRVHGA